MPATAVITYETQRFADAMADAVRLGAAHWQELYGDVPFASKPEGVAAAQDAGQFAYYVAKCDGQIVGHIGLMLFYSPVHDAKLAFDAFYYVDPAHRRHGTASKLLAFAGRDLTAQGFGVMVSALRGSGLAQVVQRAGYEFAASTYRFTGG